jgi:hypothetical protein
MKTKTIIEIAATRVAYAWGDLNNRAVRELQTQPLCRPEGGHIRHQRRSAWGRLLRKDLLGDAANLEGAS